MKWTRILTLLVAAPALSFASFSHEDCRKARNEYEAKWKAHQQRLEQFNKLEADKKPENLSLVRQALKECEEAAAKNEEILHKINKKDKKEQRKDFWSQKKQECEHFRANVQNEINYLKNFLSEFPGMFNSHKLQQLEEERQKVAALANEKVRCEKKVNNVEEVVAAYTEGAQLFEKALKLTQEMQSLLSPTDEKAQNGMKTLIETYEMAINYYENEAEEWPATYARKIAEAEKQLEWFKEVRQNFKDQGNRPQLYETEKKMVPLLKDLVAATDYAEDKKLQQDLLTEIEESIRAFEQELNILEGQEKADDGQKPAKETEIAQEQGGDETSTPPMWEEDENDSVKFDDADDDAEPNASSVESKEQTPAVQATPLTETQKAEVQKEEVVEKNETTAHTPAPVVDQPEKTKDSESTAHHGMKQNKRALQPRSKKKG